MKTPEEIATEAMTAFTIAYDEDVEERSSTFIREQIVAAIEADRAQHVGVYVPTTVHEPGAMFLREVWLDGEAPDGTKLDMTRTWGGAGIVLQIDKPDGSRIIESLNASELAQVWAKAAEARS